MTEDPTDNDYGAAAWTLFIVCFVSGLIMQVQGLASVQRDYGGYYLWWTALTANAAIPGWIYNILTPMCFLLLSIYLVKLRKREGTLATASSFSSVGAGILWLTFYLTHLSAVDLVGVAISIFYWSGSIILFGITFILVGLIYMKRDSSTLTRLTGLSFVIVGLVGLVVGYIGGFTLLPWFTIYNFPWVTTAAILPCCLALILNIRER